MKIHTLSARWADLDYTIGQKMYEVPSTTRIKALLGTVKRFIAPDLRPQHSCRHARVLTCIEQALIRHEGTFINFTEHIYQL